MRNGAPGNSRAEQKPGRLDAIFQLPESLITTGERVLAMRVSTYRGGFPAGTPTYFKLDAPVNVLTWKANNALCPLAAFGMMACFTLICGLAWLLAVRRPALLWLAGLSLAAAVMQGLLMYRWLYDYAGDLHRPLTVVSWWSNGILLWCFVGFVVEHFAVPRGRWLLLAVAPVLGGAV